MSGLSVAGYFPWCRVKLTYQNIAHHPASALVRIEPDQRYRPLCHDCRRAARTVHSHARRFIRDLDFGGHQLWLQVGYRKVWCAHCGGVRVEHLEFADSSQRVTHRLAAYAVELCRLGLTVKTEQQVRLHEILAMNQRLNTLYWLKDLLKHIWDYQRPAWAEKVLEQWCQVARQDGHPALVRFAGRLTRYQYGILNHCRHPIHTSRIEGVNNKIKVIKRNAYGFHDLEYFGLKIQQAFPGRVADN